MGTYTIVYIQIYDFLHNLFTLFIFVYTYIYMSIYESLYLGHT